MQRGTITIGGTDYAIQCSLATARIYKKVFGDDLTKSDISLLKIARKVQAIDPNAKSAEEITQVITDNPELLEVATEMQERAIRLFFIMVKEAEAGANKKKQIELLTLNELDYTLFLMDFDADIMSIETIGQINEFWNKSMVASSTSKNQDPPPSDP